MAKSRFIAAFFYRSAPACAYLTTADASNLFSLSQVMTDWARSRVTRELFLARGERVCRALLCMFKSSKQADDLRGGM